MDLFKGNQRWDRDRQPIKEKNYFFFMSNELPHIDLSRYPSGKRYYGKLFLAVTALQDIFIGCGEIEKSNNRLYDAFSYVKKSPEQVTFNIPGSSLKGSVLTNLLLFVGSDSTDFFSAMKGMAKVYFSDFPITVSGGILPRTIPARFGPRKVANHAQLKFYKKEDEAYGQLSATEFRELPAHENILTVKKGSRFEGFINFKLVNEFELTMLVLASGSLSEHGFHFKIGGARNRGMGLIDVEIDREKSFYSENLKDIVDGGGGSFRELEEKLLAVMSRMKQDFPKVATVLQRLREEYGQ